MRKIGDYENIIIYIGIAIIISLLCTCIILSNITRKTYKSKKEEKSTEVNAITSSTSIYKNSYIFSDEYGNVIFINNNRKYEVEGKLDKEYKGIADVVVSGNQLVEIRAGSDCIEGKLSSFTKSKLYINDEKSYKYTKDLPVYAIGKEEIKQISVDDALYPCYEGYKLFFRDNKICAMVLDKTIGFKNIGVLLRDGNKLFYDNIKIYNLKSKKIFDAKNYFNDSDAKQVVISNNNKMKFAGKIYEGDFVVYKKKKGFVIVNRVDIETYLKHVVPSEMPASFNKEALKAQAVCARTFAYSHMDNQRYAKYGANLDNTTSYQVYDTKIRYKKTDEAVDETKGKVALYNGNLIICYYFSTSAKLTQCMDVWKNESPKYIKQVKSKDNNSPFYKWRAVLYMKNCIDPKFGKLKNLRIVDKTKGGYINELEFVFEKGSRSYCGENNIRFALGKYIKNIRLADDTWNNNMKAIPSSCFEIKAKNDDEYVLWGGGFGHGIGLSQYGSNKMANDGKNYKEIISYYYNGVSVEEY